MTPQTNLIWFKVKYIKRINDAQTLCDKSIPAASIYDARLWAEHRWGKENIMSVEEIPVTNALIWGKK